jgi:pimeloyl-ACP methyl ester carboxylesterase
LTAVPVRWQSLRARGHGLSLNVRRVAEPVAPPALLVHGLGVSGSVLQPFARRLLPELAAVAPDLRGHGQSDAPPSGYTPTDYARDITELIDDLHLQTPAPFIGHSLGALIGLRVAELQPDLLKWLVLLDPPLDQARRNSEVPEVYRLRKAAVGELEAYLLERNPGGGELLANTLAREFRQASDAAFEAMLDAPVYEVKPLRTPILILQADPSRGGVLGDEAAETAARRLGNATLKKIPGATHALHASHAAQVADAIRQFQATYSSDGDSSSR